MELDGQKLVNLICGKDDIEEVMKYIQNNKTKMDDIIQANQWAGTLLHFSCLWNRPKVVSYLLSQNADVTKCFKDNFMMRGDFHNLTAQKIAEKKNHKEIIALFKAPRAPTKTIRAEPQSPKIELPSPKKELTSPKKVPVTIAAHKLQMNSSTQSDSPKTTKEQPQKQTISDSQYFSTKAVDLIKQHMSVIRQINNSKKRTATITFLEEKLEEDNPGDMQLFKNLEHIFIDILSKDPFDFVVYSKTWCIYLPKVFSVEASCIVEMHLKDISTKKNERTRRASFYLLEEKLENQPELIVDLHLLHEIEPKLNFNQFDIVYYLALFNMHLPQTVSPVQAQERVNRSEPPTARVAPGKRFLQFVSEAPTDPKNVIEGLKKYGTENNLPLMILQDFEEKIGDFTDANTPEETAFAMGLCWLYTAESWVYHEVNAKLREDSSSMVALVPFMKALMLSYDRFKGDETNFYAGIVYRRTKLAPKDLNFYQPDHSFVWSSFTSTSIDFSKSGEFGDILFEVTIPEKFKMYSLCLENMSAFTTEREVLLLPNIAYMVVAIEVGPTIKYPNTTHIIKVEMSYVCMVV